MRLLESQTVRESRSGGTTLSVVAHVVLMAAAIAGTASARPGAAPVEPPQEIIWVPNNPLPTTPRPAAPSGPVTDRGPSEPIVHIALPTDIPIGVSAVDVNIPRLPIEDGVTIGGPASPSRSASLGGFGSGPAYGTPDASGAWDAHTVDVPVAPSPGNPVPTYPEMLRTGGIAGRVVAEFVVDSTGRVRPGSLVIVEASHALFASSVRRAVPSFHFIPARAQGRRVAQRVRVPFEFEMAGKDD